jgi:hypothetical protein
MATAKPEVVLQVPHFCLQLLVYVEPHQLRLPWVCQSQEFWFSTSKFDFWLQEICLCLWFKHFAWPWHLNLSLLLLLVPTINRSWCCYTMRTDSSPTSKLGSENKYRKMLEMIAKNWLGRGRGNVWWQICYSYKLNVTYSCNTFQCIWNLGCIWVWC